MMNNKYNDMELANQSFGQVEVEKVQVDMNEEFASAAIWRA
jgi:hypothetical protein